MIKISKQNNSLIVEGIENAFYINNGDNSYPLNSLIVVTDKSDMATFRSVATNDVLFSGLINNITINGEVVTKDNIIAKFDAVSNSSTGGGGTVDAYTKEEADGKFATKTELTNVQTVANDADAKVNELTIRVDDVETAMGNKQDTLVSGTNIKTINSQSILGSGDLTISGVSEEQAQEIAKIPTLETDMMGKQDTLVSGTNIKTINSQSILGEGNIEISGGISEEQAQEIAKIPTLETEIAQKANVSDVPTAQIDSVGTNKNYIYSDVNSTYAGVISDIKLNHLAEQVNIRVYKWTTDASKPSYSTEFLSKATATKAGVMTAADKTKLDSISNEWTGTQSEYDALATKDNNTIYYVTE